MTTIRNCLINLSIREYLILQLSLYINTMKKKFYFSFDFYQAFKHKHLNKEKFSINNASCKLVFWIMLTFWNKSLLKEVVFIVLIISQNTVWIVYKRPEFLGTIKDLNFSADIVIFNTWSQYPKWLLFFLVIPAGFNHLGIPKE